MNRTRTLLILLPLLAACPAEKAVEAPTPVEPPPPKVEPPPPEPPQEVAPAGPFVDVLAVSSDRYQLVEESAWVRLLRAKFKPGEKDKPHSHPKSIVYAITDLPDHAAGTAFAQEAVGDFVFENNSKNDVEFLLYELETNPPAAEEVEDPGPDPVEVSPDFYKVLAENDKARLLLLAAKPGGKDKPHLIREHMTFTLTDVKGRYHFGRMQNLAVKKNQAHPQPAVPSISFENIGAKEAKVLILERK